jgi:hypothetical protein
LPGATRQPETGGFGIGDWEGAGLIRLPEAKFNPGAHCKVLAVLERRSGNDGESFPKPELRAA